MGRPSNTDQRRAQIVDAMAQVVARNGYEGASIGEIGRAAGLAPGLVHYHFENKQEIFLELIATLNSRHRERLHHVLKGTGGSPRDRLDAFVDAHLAVRDDANPSEVACWVAIAAEAIRHPLVRTAYQQVVNDDLRVLEGLIRDCLRAAGAATRRTPAIAAGIFASIQGCFVLSVASPGTIPSGSAARTVRQMAAGLLRDASLE